MRVEIELVQMTECRLIVGHRRIESSQAGRENFDAIEFGAGLIERPEELPLHAFNCCVRSHGNLVPLHVGKSHRIGDGSYFRIIDRNSIKKT